MKYFIVLTFLNLTVLSTGQTVTLDPTFIPGSGPNNTVIATAVLPDGKIIIGGGFLMVDSQQRYGAARLNTDGSLDLSFINWDNLAQTTSIGLLNNGNIVMGGDFLDIPENLVMVGVNGGIGGTAAGTGFDGNVWATTVQTDQKVLVGGSFNNYNGTSRNGIARLHSDLSLDAVFNPGTGVDGNIMDIVVLPNQKIIAAGNFTNYNGVFRSCIVLLNPDGSVDPSLLTGTGFDNGVQAVALQSDGKIVVVGGFTSYNGVSRNRIARLNASGSLDNTFNPGTGFDNYITSVNIQPDGKILVAGDFTSFNGTPRNRIARLNADGTLDTSFDPGAGFDAMIWTINTQSDGKIVVAGNFTTFDGASKPYLARLNPPAADLEEIASKSAGLKIYPNPTKDHFILELEGDLKEDSFTIYDHQGKTVNVGEISGKQIEIDHQLDNGLYYVMVGTKAVKLEVLR